MGSSFSTSRKRKSSESAPPTAPQPQQKKHKVAKPAVVDDYQVFLSFRGPDTRNDFTDVLYEHMDRVGIRVFRDEDEIPIGQQIEIILQAIENSEICVPILSKSFASSAWCLREVEKMVELDKKVMPIFYKISPDDVKLKTDLYKMPMAKHVAKHGKEQVEKWKTALKKIAKIKGRGASANTSYTEFCKTFVNDVLSELLPRKRCDTDYLVGMDNQIEGMMNLLDIGSNNRRYVVVYGMSGIGKTTLANVIFDKLSANFDNSCFFEDVRESSSRGYGPMDLQKQFLERLDPKFVGRSNLSSDIKERFCKRKVLIVLDDVDKWEQIAKLAGKPHWFGAGSRIIITTRNRDVLNKGALDDNEVRTFEMKTLDDEESFALFCWYAFRNLKTPSAELASLSREIIQGAGGLPLTLRVTGALLYKKDDVQLWRDVISRLRKTPFEEVMERLRISYDALADDQKKIFLDIACLSIAEQRARAVYMWDACELHPHWGLEVLSSMSLVKNYVGDNKIWMHDQLRDLGKKIVREESEDPTKRSRLWEHKEALKVLMSIQGKEKVEALCIDSATNVTLSREHFASFRELRFLKLAGANIIGDFDNLLPNLRWLSWHLCSPIMSATNLYMENLVILDLSFSFIDESWGGWSLIQILNSLKVLDLSNCHNLTRTPDLSETNRLERFDLHHCSELHEIHSSIGKLQRLKYLNLNYCYSLDGLPNEIGSLVNLEELRVSGCCTSRGNFNLPSSIGNLESLLVLELEDLDIVDIPDSIGGLAKLKHLSLQGCSRIKKLPESLGNLESLSELELSHVGLSELPNSIRGLVKLKTLQLDRCSNLEVLPESLGYLESLSKLDLSWTRISELPNSFGGLVKLELLQLRGCCNLEVLPESLGRLGELKVLELGNCKIRKLPESIGMMKKLRSINYIYGAYMLEEVPMEIGSLSSLRRLILSRSSISTLPSTVSQLPLLEELDLTMNHQLQELPTLPSSLSILRVSSQTLQKTPDFSILANLIDLELFGIDDYRWPTESSKSNFKGIEKLTKLEDLHLGLANATALLQFDMGSLTLLESLNLDFQPNLTSVHDLLPSAASSHDLDISLARLGFKLPDLSSLKSVSNLSFYNCLIKDGLESLGIRHLRNLTDVTIVNCGVELIELCLMKNLRSLVIIRCESLRTLPNLSELKNLNRLDVSKCKQLIEIPGLGNLEPLFNLSIEDCDSLERLENLSKLEKLSLISFNNCPKLKTIEGTDRLFFSRLVLDKCGSIQNVDELRKRSKEGYINGLGFQNFR